VRLGPITPGDYVRARVLVPLKLGCDKSGVGGGGLRTISRRRLCSAVDCLVPWPGGSSAPLLVSYPSLYSSSCALRVNASGLGVVSLGAELGFTGEVSAVGPAPPPHLAFRVEDKGASVDLI
jgi:hypothetical protein